MGKTLVIAEKPSVAADIARALGGFKKTGDFFESDKFVVSSAIGHLVELAAPEGVEPKRGKWNLENLPVLPEAFDLRPIEKTEARFKSLKKLLKRPDIDALINACDAGREGELIFRNLVKLAGSRKPLRRLWLQSMTPQAIRTAFEHLRSDEELRPLADAAVSRSESDWLVGINSTRALTAFNSRLVGGFQKTTAGRVQTPTLAILVEREEKIRAFKSRIYWEVFGDFGVAAGSYRGRWFDENFKKGAEEDTRPERIWERAQADAIEQKCRGKTGAVAEEKKPQTQIPPLLYDLTTLQREANSRFGLPANRTLQIAQALYERHKVLTYPRTDSRYLPEDYLGTTRNVLAGLTDPGLARHAAKALENGWVHPNKRIFNDAKVSDHFAIVPTGVPPRELDDMQAKIYDMVTRRFVAVFFPQAEFELTTRITTVESEKFKTEGKIIVKPGWLEVYGRQMEGENQSLVPIAHGETARVDTIEIKESETKPPARFNEATLLSAMEGAGKMVDDEELREAMREKGLGTPATRAAVIEGLIFEGYVERKVRDLIATSKGISLITLLRNVRAETLCKPEMTGEWEFKLKQMERGQLSRDTFMHQIRDLTREIVDKVKGFGEKPIEGEFLTLEIKCPQCGGGPYKEDYRTYTCATCGLRVWKSMAGREFEPDEVKELLTHGRVGPLDGFRSKIGRAFSALVKLGEENKPQFEFENNGSSATDDAVDLSTLAPVAPCPVCNAGQVYELERAYVCENHLRPKPGGKTCDLRIGKVILQKAISTDQMRKLLTEGKTGLIAGFVSKKGKARPFSAFLKLDAKGKISWEFPPREPKPKRPAPAKAP